MTNYSVLMTVYEKDSPEFFMISVYSMLNQTTPTNDFVLVCDGPLSDELEVCITNIVNEYEGVFNIVRLPENVGLGAALRIGVLLCKNDLVARMDSDDIAHVDRCQKQIEYIESHPNVSIVGACVNEFADTPDKPIRIRKVPISENEIFKFSKRRNPFNHSTVMIKKNDLVKAGNYSTLRTNQDVDTWVRLLNQGFLGANLEEALVDFRFDENTYLRRKNWENVKLMMKVWKGFYRNNYCSVSDYSFVILVQFSLYIMPIWLIKWAYNHLR